ncbi:MULTISPECIES: MATE family efflux transporter [Marinobacter]|uniref:MATE family efflux transporter n=1 Tax=Marinobacter xestospongiae TaxID=994319 RepID=A0ABU3VV59_9GAMM|nr:MULTISPECIES: MATE family efflux transporter [Marinobacter]MCG8519327.1 MATE family efflux transporter [Pseudomonadales bacterium]MCK7566283.1 MATE family efflux transporter [Marinobacter xestospongiae]MDV2078144.1 MATE family efflux transporter [Marinobacter xestospongiae]
MPSNASLPRQLFSMTWPMLFGVLSLMTFQLVDSAFIGQLGRDPLAALGFTLPMQQLVIGLQVGLGIATTAIISRTLGAGDEARAQRLGGLVVVVGAVMVLALCLALWLVRNPIMTLLGADAHLLPLIRDYWLPWLLSAWLGAMLYFGYSVCRSHGNTKLPGIMMMVTSLLNIALDPLFIFVFGWGLPGAALATVTAFAIGCLAIYPRLLSQGWLRFDLAGLSLPNALRQLGGIMAPAMVSQLMPPLAAMLATALVAGFGASAVAAWGLGTRLEFFSIVVVLALTMSMPPMIGRLLGAGDLEQIRRLVRLAVRFVVVWQLVIGVLWLAASGLVSQLFSSDTSVQTVLQSYLVRVPLSYAGLGICMLMVSVCNALGLAMRALLVSTLRLFLCFLPLLWLGGQLAGITGLMTGALAGNLLAGLMAYQFYRAGLNALTARTAGSAAT